MGVFLAHFMLQAKLLVRMPGYWVPTLVFPAMLFSFFGASAAGDTQRSAYTMASFCIYAIAGVAFYQFGAGLAQDRETPFDSWSRTLPGSTLPAIAARVACAGLFGVAAVGLVIVAAQLLAPPNLSAGSFARLLAVCGLNAIPAAFMGITLGYLASARVAVALANLIYLPLAYVGGLWVPPQALPPTINAISQWTPTRHMAELAWHVVAGAELPMRSLAAVAAFTLLFAGTAWLAAKRDARRRFG